MVLSVIYSYIPDELPEENRPYALNTVVDNICHLFYRPMIKWVAILSRAYVHVSFIKFIDFGARIGPSAHCTLSLSLSHNFLLSISRFHFVEWPSHFYFQMEMEINKDKLCWVYTISFVSTCIRVDFFVIFCCCLCLCWCCCCCYCCCSLIAYSHRKCYSFRMHYYQRFIICGIGSKGSLSNWMYRKASYLRSACIK